jgi:hypothetical protein
VEQAHVTVTYSNLVNTTTVMQRNAAGDKGVTLHRSTDELPCLLLRINTGAAGEAYLTGIEPGTSQCAKNAIERAARNGHKPALRHNSVFRINFGIRDSARKVTGAATDNKRLQAGRPTTANAETIRSYCIAIRL